jgi:hypothetical protein
MSTDVLTLQDIEDLKGMVHQLTTQVNEFKQHQQQPQYYKGNNYRDNRGRRWNNSSHECVLLVHNVDNRSYYPVRHTLSVGQSVAVVVDMNSVEVDMNSVEVGMNSVEVDMNSVVVGMNSVGRTHSDWLSCEIRSHQTFKLQET